jgi:hypothetical protein
MRPLSVDELAGMVGGDYTRSECVGLGFGAGVAVLTGGPVGWVGAAIFAWQAYEGGCFK